MWKKSLARTLNVVGSGVTSFDQCVIFLCIVCMTVDVAFFFTGAKRNEGIWLEKEVE